MGGVGRVEGEEGGEGGDPKVVITTRLPLPPYWGRIILDVQGRPSLAED